MSESITDSRNSSPNRRFRQPGLQSYQLQASSNGISLTYSTLDNLGEVTSTAVYDLTTPVNSSPTTVSASGGEVNVNANMGMRALSDSYRAGSC